MPNYHKMDKVSSIVGKKFNDLLNELYVEQKLSGKEISDKIFSLTKISITTRSIQRQLKKLKLIRSFSEAFKLAIANGRKSYAHLKKPMKSVELRKGINLKTRHKTMERDNFCCVLCGRKPPETSLVIDHVIPVVSGGTNTPDNLQTLCRECNHGKMLLKEKHL